MIRSVLRIGQAAPQALSRSFFTSSVSRASFSSSSPNSSNTSERKWGEAPASRRAPAKPVSEPPSVQESSTSVPGAPLVQESSSSVPGAPLVRESSSSPEEMNTRPLPYLAFALGVPFKPSSSPQTWQEKKEQYLSDEHRMASRRAIVKEATRGYFHDFHAIKSHGGKTWRAANTMIKEDRAMWFPRIEATRLSDKAKVNTVDVLHNKVSVVAVLGSKISEEHTKSFYESTMSSYASNPKFQLVQINLQSNPLKSFMVSLFLSSLKQHIAESLHATYLFSTQDMELEKDAMGLHNKHVGYTYLIDQQGRIRWAGCAFAEPAESKALLTCTGILLNRTDNAQKR